MTPAESAKVAQLLTIALERNVDARLTPELATGILTLVTHQMQPMVKEEEAEANGDGN